MYVLGSMVEAVKPGGLVLDLQVIRPNPIVEVDGEVVGEIDGEPLFRMADAATAAVDTLVAQRTLVEQATDDHDVRRALRQRSRPARRLRRQAPTTPRRRPAGSTTHSRDRASCVNAVACDGSRCAKGTDRTTIWSQAQGSPLGDGSNRDTLPGPVVWSDANFLPNFSPNYLIHPHSISPYLRLFGSTMPLTTQPRHPLAGCHAEGREFESLHPLKTPAKRGFSSFATEPSSRTFSPFSPSLEPRFPKPAVRGFKSRNWLASTVSLSLMFGIFFGNIVLTPLWLQQQMGYTATWAGYAMAPMGILAVLTAPIVGRLVPPRSTGGSSASAWVWRRPSSCVPARPAAPGPGQPCRRPGPGRRTPPAAGPRRRR